ALMPLRWAKRLSPWALPVPWSRTTFCFPAIATTLRYCGAGSLWKTSYCFGVAMSAAATGLDRRMTFHSAFPLSQAPHAAGVGYDFKYRKQARAAVCFLGDGATSKGDVWEAMNFSGVWKLPVVFVINNNQWAISVPLKTQTASQTLAQKAIAAGFCGEQVDGN